MDAINPWLDPSEVRHLAEQLLRPVAPTRLSTADPGFDSTFVGFISEDVEATPTPTPAPPPTPTPPKAPLRQAEIPPHPIPAPQISPPNAHPNLDTPTRTRFLKRIQIFRDWLAKNFRAADIFILDCDGKVIFDESGHGRLHFMARNLAAASSNSANIHVKIGPASILEVIPSETPYGRVILGCIVPEALPANHVKIITEVLIQTASPA